MVECDKRDRSKGLFVTDYNLPFKLVLSLVSFSPLSLSLFSFSCCDPFLLYPMQVA
jgi:hypothetical protein